MLGTCRTLGGQISGIIFTQCIPMLVAINASTTMCNLSGAWVPGGWSYGSDHEMHQELDARRGSSEWLFTPILWLVEHDNFNLVS